MTVTKKPKTATAAKTPKGPDRAHVDAARLGDFVFGHGTREERLAVATHLARCDACLEELRLTCLMATALSPEALMRPPEVALAGLFEHIRMAQASAAPAPSSAIQAAASIAPTTTRSRRRRGS